MIRVGYVLFWIIIFLLPVALVSALPGTYCHRVYRWFYKILCMIYRVRITVKGKISNKEPIMFVSNHMSYLDIMVLGSVLPGSFISKAEVRKWPVIGWLGTLSGTVYVDRKKSAAGGHLKALEDAVAGGKNLILFPEGTTSEGKEVLPFKSSLFKIAESGNITIQPITINYTHINGLPVQANERLKIAWIGDMELMPHMKELFSLGIIRAEVIIHEPLEINNTEPLDRKKLAEQSWEVVSGGKR